MLISLTGSPT